MPIHPPGTIENGLDEEACMGLVDPMTLPEVAAPAVKEDKGERKIDISEIIGIPDFDVSGSDGDCLELAIDARGRNR